MSRDLRLRLGGVVVIVLGVVLLWFFLLGPLRAAQAGAPEVSYSMRAFILVPFCLIFGIAFVLFGDRFEYRTADHKNLTAIGWALFAGVCALTALGWWWFDGQFTALGYV